MVRVGSIRLVVVAVVISTFLPPVISVGHAQASPVKSPVTFRVFDVKGAAIANCVVVIRNDSEVIASHTEADGSLTLSLQSGKYSVTASKAGFVRTNLEVQGPNFGTTSRRDDSGSHRILRDYRRVNVWLHYGRAYLGSQPNRCLNCDTRVS